MYNNEYGLNILETQIVQRDFDKRWEKIVKIMDTENQYTYRNESGINVTLIPEKWLTVAVYDFIMEIV
jgi:hypothetical protein